MIVSFLYNTVDGFTLKSLFFPSSDNPFSKSSMTISVGVDLDRDTRIIIKTRTQMGPFMAS